MKIATQKSFSVRFKLFGSSLVILSVVAALLVYSAVSLKDIVNRNDAMYSVYQQGARQLNTVTDKLYKAEAAASRLALAFTGTRTSVQTNSTGNALKWSTAGALTALEDFKKTVPETFRSEMTNSLLEQFVRGYERWAERNARLGDAIGDPERYMTEYVGDSAAASSFDELIMTIDQLQNEMSVASTQAYQGIRLINARALVVFAVLAAILALIVFAVTLAQDRLIVQPIKGVYGRLQSIAEGEADLTQTLTFKKNDEIGGICRKFNQFTSRLRDTIAVVKENTENTSQVAGVLSESSASVTSALTEIDANTRGIRNSVATLEGMLNDTSTSTGALVEALGELQVRIREEAAKLESSTGSIGRMIECINSVADVTDKERQTVSTLTESVRTGSRCLDETTESVARINASIGMILEMTTVISGIAEKTNILSMNAAIEAAHAGAAGAGFSVVADEIRNLANTTAEQSEDIDKELNGIVQEIQNAWKRSTDTKEIFAGIAAEISNVVATLETIIESNRELRDSGSSILQAMTELGRASGLTHENMSRIEKSTGEVSAIVKEVRRVGDEVFTGIEEIAEGTTEITGAMHRVHDIDGRLIDQVNVLVREMSQFKTA